MRFVVTILLIACSSPSTTTSTIPVEPTQSFHDGIQLLCELPDHVPDNGKPYDQRLDAVAEWADHNVINTDAKQIGSVRSLTANRDAFAAAVGKAGITHCKLLDNGMELQSFAEAMKILCSAQPEPNYLTTHLLNVEVVKMLAALGNANPADRRRILEQAVVKSGLTKCALFEPAAPSLAGKAPVVADHGLVALEPDLPTVIITPTGIVVEGKAIVSVANGDVDPAEKEGGTMGISIPRLKTFLTAFARELAARAAAPVDKLTLIVEPATPYRLLIEVMFTAKQAGFRELSLAVIADGAIKAIPLVLPDKAGSHKGVRVVVAVTKDKLIVWSLSGQEGTLKKPKLAVAGDRTGEVQQALAEIVARRWPDGTRAADEHHLVLMADGTMPMQMLADLMVAVRSSNDGKELFNDLWLSTGLE
jgi:biopolymer transport protein ExbD